MKLYLDTSVVVPLFARDYFNRDAEKIVGGWRGNVVVSDFAGTEFASVLAVRVRTTVLTMEEAQLALRRFDAWSAGPANVILVNSADILEATKLIRRFELPLRAGDGIHLAAAQRLGAMLATFDQQMARNAAAFGIAVASS